RIVAAALVAPLLLASGLTAGALENTPVENLGSGKPVAAAPSPNETLDALFETLKTAKTEDEATKAENEIIAVWLKSGSDTIDLRRWWSERASDEKDFNTALDFLDRVVTMKPEFAEGWNKRATVYYLTDKYSRSLADIERVLAIEPRH